MLNVLLASLCGDGHYIESELSFPGAFSEPDICRFHQESHLPVVYKLFGLAVLLSTSVLYFYEYSGFTMRSDDIDFHVVLPPISL